jgi:hypothetical protein
VIVYADASALVKRYVNEAGTELVRRWLAEAEQVVCSRFGYVETHRAIVGAGGEKTAEHLAAFERDWDRIAVVEVDDALVRRAAVLASGLGLRSLDAMHLAAAEQVGGTDFALATWDRRLWQAARTLGIQTLPDEEP